MDRLSVIQEGIFCVATVADIDPMHAVRLAVKENVLSNSLLITYADYEAYLFRRGKGWVCKAEGVVVGFAIADAKENNIWALFVHPDWEGRGIGKRLHQLMLDWYFDQGKDDVWLSTAPRSRAANFYRLQGWKETGVTKSGELKFEMARKDWRQLSLTDQ